jgi:hypothetical protein
MSRSVRVVLVIATAIGLYQAAARANGSAMPAPSSGSGSMSMPTMTPEERAVAAYNSGNDHREKGRKLEEQAAAKQGPDRDKTAKKATRSTTRR